MRKSRLKGLLIFAVALLITGCQYQFGQGSLFDHYSSISIPYIEGDTNGELTAELIRQFTTSSTVSYLECGGRLTLKAKFLGYVDDNVGFRYDRKKDGKLKRYIIPTETRVYASVEVGVYDSSKGCLVLGPTIVTASMDFDHEYYSDRKAANVFSLGQLVDIDTARDTVAHPLNRLLAEKIVDYVIHSF